VLRLLPARLADRDARIASLKSNGNLLLLVGAWAWAAFGLFWAARFCKTHQLGVLTFGAEPARQFEMLSSVLVLATAMLSCGLLGFLLERFAYRPLRSSPRLNVLITAIGVSLLLQNTGQLKWVFGPSPKRMPSLLPDVILVEVAGVPIHLVDVISAGTAVLLMLALEWLVFRTKLGRAMRAVSFSPTNAALMGIPVDRVISFTFVTGAMLAAAAGFLYALKYPGLNQPAYPTWLLLGLKAFVAAVVGGIGNVRGAMLGGIFIGWIEFFGVAYVGSTLASIGETVGASGETVDYLSTLGTSLRDVYVFALLILVLLVRPSGILGRATVEKV
jgi:branched-chain amino acid transport system permease protein